MKLYAVRIRLKHEPVGIFWGPDISDLEEAIAEVTDLRICEYLEITEPGALTWHDPENWQLGVRDNAVHEASEEVFYEGEAVTGMFVSYRGWEDHINKVKACMTFEGSLEDLVVDNVEGKWKRYEPSYTPSVSDALLLKMWADKEAEIEAASQAIAPPEGWEAHPTATIRKLGAPELRR